MGMFARVSRSANTPSDREEYLLEAMRAFVGASRTSSNAVLDALESRIVAREPAFDAFLAFVPAGDELWCIAARGARAEHFSGLHIRRDALHALPAQAAHAGHRASGREGVIIPTDRRGLAVPMCDDGALRAVIYVSSSLDGGVADEDGIVRAIESAGAAFALACEREADRADATYDALTGLLTPRAFRARLAGEVARRKITGSKILSLWFVDTDHFKAVNDTFGHAAGDAVLQAMAELLRAAAIPEVDVVGRNGGDEFCALIFDSQKTVAIERAADLCETVRRYDFGVAASISASIGVASFPYDANDSSELLEVADAAMYHSKRNGRDRVSFAVNGSSFAVYR
jgi:diguanylate cyclase (GGDEF)-like protein